jgi:hypothetical protein
MTEIILSFTHMKELELEVSPTQTILAQKTKTQNRDQSNTPYITQINGVEK